MKKRSITASEIKGLQEGAEMVSRTDAGRIAKRIKLLRAKDGNLHWYFYSKSRVFESIGECCDGIVNMHKWELCSL